MATKKTRKPKTPPENGTKIPQAPKPASPPALETSAATTAKKLSALDAAAQLLAETGEAMTCLEMIQAMAARGSWTSPAGKTPQATLYSAILREIKTKGIDARFKKTERGKFAPAWPS